MGRVLGARGSSVAVAALTACVACAASIAAPAAKTVTVRVTAKDFSFALSRRTVPAGTTVRFVVTNRGTHRHDFAIAGRRTRLLPPGGTQTLTVRFAKTGRFRFLCTVPGHAQLGMRGTFVVGKRAPSPTPPVPPVVDVSQAARLERVGTFERPVLVTAPVGDSRLFVVEQAGTIRVVKGDTTSPAPFLDIRERVRAVSESGLLALAFAPDYATSGKAYVIHNNTQGNGDLELAEYTRHAANPDLLDPSSRRTLLTIHEPWENHNGGMLQFGPDGYLYVSVGDGDSGVLNPPGAFAQTLDDLLGSILRIDPRGGVPYAVPPGNPFAAVPGARPEIWAYGLRNPWRFWIDPQTGTMLIGDVGLAQREEIDVVPAGAAGLNFGWPCFEGTLPFDTTRTCADPVAPLVDIPREGGICALIGGVVVRDPRLPALVGRYLYGDFCSGRIAALTLPGSGSSDSRELGLVVPQLESFGVDGQGRVYVTALSGEVYRLEPAPED